MTPATAAPVAAPVAVDIASPGPALAASSPGTTGSVLPVSAVAVPAAASAAAAAASASLSTPPPPPSCAGVTDRAMAVDLQAANAQAQRAEMADQARLLDESSRLWSQAVDLCTGRARDRAQRNLGDSRKARTAIGELQGAGVGCLVSQKDAATLEELARRVLGERRWADAAGLFRRAETQWELAGERCSGPQQQVAQQRRELAEMDAHNAEHCAPRFQVAMEHTQRLRSSGAAWPPAERQTQSLIAETLWRQAIDSCRGAALDLARSQAQTLSRERGTPWVATLPPEPVARVARPAAMASSAPTSAPTPASVSSVPGVARSAAVASSAPPPSTPAAVPVVPATPQKIDAVLGADTRLSGLFTLDPGGQTYSGQGKINWANGEAYDGMVVRGKRHGSGEFTWTTGQRYRGDWVDDRPRGQGRMQFANGNLYEGAVVDGQPQGQGHMVYASGDVYTGDFAAGEPHGNGKYRWVSGQRYEGPWAMGKARGRGNLVFANGNQYDGEVEGGLPHGQGRLRFASGDTYEGRLVHGLPDGEGRYQWKNGDNYAGGWKAGQRDGPGTMTWANGDRWDGTFRADAQTEQGQLTRATKP
ncbi:hypothetical protein [Ideonella sp. A 288]|uniref:hypothetical protein n=1 Tax=Ideonella sp. A 288 TaxID=1962181 RepID=UPI0013035773|nr:hypothetical protein [Ideonella sp. A 288]